MVIPKIIHQIWVGNSPIPKQSEVYIQKIKELHPDYEYKLWTNNDITEENFINIEFIKKQTKNAQKADIMRYEILYKYGGIYLDIDMEVFQSLSPLLTHSLIVCNEDANINNYMSIGFIACTKQNSQLLNCVNSIQYTDWNKTINIATGPYFFRKCITLDANVRVLPTHFCYPTHWTKKHEIPKLNNTIFMWHHWNKNW
jgi:mannosyltransferase OCH1-like enzyme